MARAGSGSPSHPEAKPLALLRAGPPPRCHKYDTATRYNGAVCSATPLRADPLGDGLRRPSPLLLRLGSRFRRKSPQATADPQPWPRSARSIRLATSVAAAFTGSAGQVNVPSGGSRLGGSRVSYRRSVSPIPQPPRRPDRGEPQSWRSPRCRLPTEVEGRGVDRSQLVRDYPSRRLGLASPGTDRQRLRSQEPRPSSWGRPGSGRNQIRRSTGLASNAADAIQGSPRPPWGPNGQ